MKPTGFLVLESGQIFPGQWRTGDCSAGEVVFNTSHSGYEEMATDPSYYSQILVTTSPMQGNYGADQACWESARFWIRGFVCLEVQDSPRDSSWLKALEQQGVPCLSHVDTRSLVFELRENGSSWGALIKSLHQKEAMEKATELLTMTKKAQGLDWVSHVSLTQAMEIVGQNPLGPRIAVIDLGCKKNSLRELMKRASMIKVFPSRTSAREILAFRPQGVFLSNGPGDPQDVVTTVDTVRELLGSAYIFGICMGHQILALALGGRTYKLKFGHRGSNHPIKDVVLNKIYITSQNHGYNVDMKSLPSDVGVTHINLNDNTIAGLECARLKCSSVQFHPESHPGPHDATEIFDQFFRHMQ